MSKLTQICAAAALAFVASSASAATILVDNFNAPVVAATDTDSVRNDNAFDLLFTETVAGGTFLTTGGVAATRQIYLNEMGGGPSRSDVTIGGGPVDGALVFNTALGTTSAPNTTHGRVVWTINQFDLGAGPYELLFNIVASAVGTSSTNSSITFSFVGTTNWSQSFTFPASDDPVSVPFALLGAQAEAFADGGVLTLDITGGRGWNMAIDSFSIEVPEPSSLALVGLALVGAGVAARRRKTAK
jgi:hypothetical protein